MFVLPVGTDRGIGKVPLATAALIAACVVVFLATNSRLEHQTREENEVFSLIVEDYLKHPWVVLPDKTIDELPELVQRVYFLNHSIVASYDKDPAAAEEELRERTPDKMSAALEKAIVNVGQPRSLDSMVNNPTLARAKLFARLVETTEGERRVAQARVNVLLEKQAAMREVSVLGNYGYVPAAPSIRGLFTYSFLHGGWLHLIFNLLFLWVAAGAIEAYWSAAGVLIVFVSGAALGAITHAGVHPTSMSPLIGASGAVAAFFGAYLVRLHSVPIRFVYIRGLSMNARRFTARATVLIPCWLAGEIFYGLFLDTGEVAYWAHIGGFGAGVTIALLIRIARVEERIFGYDPATESESHTYEGEPGIDYEVPARTEAPAGPQLAAPAATEESGEIELSAYDGPPDFERGDGVGDDNLPYAPTREAEPVSNAPPDLQARLYAALEAKDEPLALNTFAELRTQGIPPALPTPLHTLHLARTLLQAGYAADAYNCCQQAAQADMDGTYAPQAIFLAGRLMAEKLDRRADGLSLLKQLTLNYPEHPFAEKARALIARLED